MSFISKIEEATEFTQNFRIQFKDKFGILPYVYFSEKGLKKPSIDLGILEESINKFIYGKFGNTYPNGVRQRTREKPFIMYRQILFYIAVDMGYQLKLISKFYGDQKPWSHATVLHSCFKVRTYIEIKDKEFLKIYTDIKDDFQKRFIDERDIQFTSTKQDIS